MPAPGRAARRRVGADDASTPVSPSAAILARSARAARPFSMNRLVGARDRPRDRRRRCRRGVENANAGIDRSPTANLPCARMLKSASRAVAGRAESLPGGAARARRAYGMMRTAKLRLLGRAPPVQVIGEHFARHLSTAPRSGVRVERPVGQADQPRYRIIEMLGTRRTAVARPRAADFEPGVAALLALELGGDRLHRQRRRW
jgi:hypothetical protein